MRPDGVVVLTPAFDQHLGFVQRGEDLAVEKLVTQLAVEALVAAILPGASRFDEQGLNAYRSFRILCSHPGPARLSFTRDPESDL